MADNNCKYQDRKMHTTSNILIADNDPEASRVILKLLAQKGIHADLAATKKMAVAFMEDSSYDLIFTACKINRQSDIEDDGLELLNQIKENHPEMPVIMLLNEHKVNPRKAVEISVKAVKAGCRDCLLKPLDEEKLKLTIETFLPNRQIYLQAAADRKTQNFYNIVGSSLELKKTIQLARRISPTSAPVLISGESGTGKELISSLIHHESRRSNAPYIKINCAALNDSLLESELFGHEKGAFTGAHSQRRGRFEMAHGGTLLLDEITETPLKFQAKLLRILEHQEFERVGGEKTVSTDVRIISTTNKDLRKEVVQQRFRSDLYYRLSGVRLIISPLRDRLDDLPDLVWYFVNQYAKQTPRRITKLDPEMLRVFSQYNWPGNIRQLRNVVLTCLILGTGETLSLAEVSWLFDEAEPADLSTQQSFDTSASQNINTLAGMSLRDLEQQAIIETLKEADGNQTRAAKVLGITDRTLRGKIKQYKEQGQMQLT